MGGGGRQTNDDAAAAQAIRALVQPTDGRVLRSAVVITQTEDPDGSAPRTEVYYPLGTPDRATERAMLSRATDQLRD